MFLVIPLTWAGSFIAGKYVVITVSPIDGVFWRFALSTIIIMPFLFIFHRKAHPNFKNIKYIYHMILIVLTGGIGYHIFFFWALKYTTPTNTSLIIALNPFFTAFGEILILKIFRPKRFYIGFILAFLGAIWVNLSRGTGISLPGIGELFCLIAAIFWSIYTLAAKATKQKEWDSLWINAYNYLFTALLIIPFTSSMILPSGWENISSAGWLGLWYMAIFPTAFGYTIFYIGIQKKGAAWATTFIYLVPSFTASLDHPMIIGTSLVVMGLIIGNVNSQQLLYLKNKIVTYTDFFGKILKSI